MRKFENKKLSDLVNRVKVGFVGSINEYYCGSVSGIPLIRTTDIEDSGINFSNLKYVTKAFHLKNKKSQIKYGDLVIARHGENGKANIFKEHFEAQVLNAVIIEPDSKKISSTLLKYFFDTPFIKRQISGVVKGSVQGVINTGHISELQIPINKEINYVDACLLLSALDDKIELNNKINAALEAMAKTLYDYWFVQFDFSDANGKPYKSSGGKMVYNEILKRKIPEGWEVKSLGEFGEFKNGINYDPKEKGDCLARIINVRNISNSRVFIDENDLDEIELKLNDVKKYLVNDRSIIIARSGIPGATRIIQNYKENTIYCGFIIQLEVKHISWKNILFFNLKDFEKNITSQSNGTIMQNVNQQVLKGLRICLPASPAIVSRFNNVISPIFSKITNCNQQFRELSTLRDWLLPMLMNGQVSVGKAYEQVEEILSVAAEDGIEYKS